VKDRKALVVFMMLAALLLAFVGCKNDDSESPEQSAYETLAAYLMANDLDLSDIVTGWTIAAADVAGNEDDYYIIDIRSSNDFATGHIAGAVNTTLGNVLDTAANSGGKPIIVVCYTGQSAGHAVVALRLSGYSDARVLLFGMSSWNADFDSWTANIGDIAVGHANWTTDATAALQEFGQPTISTSATNGADILADQVDAMLAGGFQGVNASDVLASPESYFINNYWAQTDVDTYGHIAGAYRIKENLTLAAGGFGNLDPSETIVTYCWTGQTSSVVTAYLTVLGYDAKSLKFGVNAMIYSQLAAHQWTEPGDYPYETG
jgi:rhodanese-related sulfurtransferase